MTSHEDAMDTFILTLRGRDSLVVDQHYRDPARLIHFRLHNVSSKSDCFDLVPFEAMLELARRGWTYEHRKMSRKLQPVLPDGSVPKVWFYHSNVCKYYLRALLNADKLFSLGLKEIHHFQPSTYYKTLLLMMQHPERLNDVKPWQNRAFYVLLQQQTRKCKSEDKKVDADATMKLEIEHTGVRTGWRREQEQQQPNKPHTSIHTRHIIMLAQTNHIKNIQ